MQNSNNKYWCFVCEAQFTSPIKAQKCPNCNEGAIETIDTQNQDSLSNFQTYEIPVQQPTRTPMANQPPFSIFSFSTMQNNGQALDINSLFQSLNQPNNGNINSTFMNLTERILGMVNGLLQNGGSHTSASESQMERLIKVNDVKECIICMDILEEGKQGFRLPCTHCFHVVCLKPWLQKADTCPTCREKI